MIKCTALFAYNSNVSGINTTLRRSGGWSEGIYYDGTAAQAASAFIDWCALRAQLLPKGTAIIGQRYQVVDGGSSTSGRLFPGNVAYAADVPQAGVMLTAEAANGVNVRRWTYRGIPDIMTTEGEYVPTPTFKTLLRNAAQFATGGAWRFRARVLDNPLYELVSITEAGVLTLYSDSDFQVGDVLRMFKVTDENDNSVTGTFKVAVRTTAGIFTLAHWPGKVAISGAVRKETLDFFQINGTTLSDGKLVVRKVGRPFGGYRGRASVRR